MNSPFFWPDTGDFNMYLHSQTEANLRHFRPLTCSKDPSFSHPLLPNIWTSKPKLPSYLKTKNSPASNELSFTNSCQPLWKNKWPTSCFTFTGQTLPLWHLRNDSSIIFPWKFLTKAGGIRYKIIRLRLIITEPTSWEVTSHK